MKYLALFSLLLTAPAFAGVRPVQQQHGPQPRPAPVDMTNVMTPFQFNMMEPFLNNTMRERLQPHDAHLSPSPQQVMTMSAPQSSVTPLAAFAIPTAGGEARQARRAVARDGTPRPVQQPVPTQARAAQTPGGVMQSPLAAPTSFAPNAARTAPGTARGGPNLPPANRMQQNPHVRQGNNPNINQARAAATGAVQTSAAVAGNRGQAAPNQTRRVVARSTTNNNRPQNPNAGREQYTPGVRPGDITPAQCLANYTACMDNYCHRPNTPFDRCFCSARLAQLDAEHRPVIDNLTRRLLIHQVGGPVTGGMTPEEINQIWGELFGASGVNNMELLDAHLQINWSDMESQRRGQQAFVTGDSFCRQNLRGCFFMEENMRSMYRTTMAQDCRNYENMLRRTRHSLELAVRQFE